MATATDIAHNARNASTGLQDSGRTRNLRVLRSLMGPAWRGLFLQQGKAGPATDIEACHRVHFTWTYDHDRPAFEKLTAAARKGQWDPDMLAWETAVEDDDADHPLFAPGNNPLDAIPGYAALEAREQARLSRDMMAWVLSQFLHGEQGALYVACQLTEAVSWTDGKLYGATQVMDEARHIEVFERYVRHKLERRYDINDNLFVMLDALMVDHRWDLKFLGMQLMVEGLALGAFGVVRATTGEPLLAELLRAVITDEARHVHFGVLALQEIVKNELSPSERAEREDWAYEMSVLMRNRFLAHEFYEEHYAHAMSRRAWEAHMHASTYLARFRELTFKRLIPNLKRVGLLSDRVRPHYEALGLLRFEAGKAAPDLSADDLIAA